MPAISFFSEGLVFSLDRPNATRDWLRTVIQAEGSALRSLTIVFCTDEQLHEMNVRYLTHDTLTDVITFDNSDGSGYVEGDIYISLDRVFENALQFQRPFLEEVHRVIIHGTLHLLGYSDKGTAQKRRMRQKEDHYLSVDGVPRETFI